MSHGSRALLSGLIDYAGLFPPAALDLGPALQNFAAYRTGADAWMLGRFIVPVGRLADVEGGAVGGGPARFSVLGHAASGDGWAEAALQTLADARAWERQTENVAADRFELKLPAALARDPDTLGGALDALEEAEGGATGPRFALEVPYLDAPDALAPAAQAVADANGRAGRPAFALKLRCGGETPDLVPGVEALAAALTEARQAGAPFKATAGLHHPLPTWDEAVGARTHGFVNVFGGAALARVHGLGADDLAEVLDTDGPDDWALDDDGLAWRGLRTSPAEIADAREQAALSYGSCSFDEPREDLRALGWL